MITSKLSLSVAVMVCTFLFFVSALPSSAEHHENWTEIRSPHFTVISNAANTTAAASPCSLRKCAPCSSSFIPN
jgi:hypothetical protein